MTVNRVVNIAPFLEDFWQCCHEKMCLKIITPKKLIRFSFKQQGTTGNDK